MAITSFIKRIVLGILTFGIEAAIEEEKNQIQPLR